MLKKVIATLKLALTAGKATPMPPIGPALGQYGLDIAAFCKEYNLLTLKHESTIVPVEITIYDNRTYDFILKTPPTSRLLLQYAKISKGSSESNKRVVGTISHAMLMEIAKLKLLDFNTQNLEKAFLIILGTAKNMGIQIV